MRPSPSRESCSSGLSSGPSITVDALVGAGIDQAEPAAPLRRIAIGAFEPARHRMTLAELGELCAIGHVGGAPAGSAGSTVSSGVRHRLVWLA